LQKADERYAILSQSPEAAAPAAQRKSGNLRRLAPVVLGIGLAGVIFVAGWQLWPQANANDLVGGANQARADGKRSLLRPTFTSTPKPAGASQQRTVSDETQVVPMQIVIVTPTPNPNRLVNVGGAIIDRPLAVAGAELALAQGDFQPSVAGLSPAVAIVALRQPVFDGSAIVVPPMVEEVIDGPLAQVEVIPLPGLEPKITPAPTFTPPPTPTPLPELAAGPVRKWASFQPLASAQTDHLWVGPAFVAGEYNQIGAPSYQFGSTGGGRYRAHHGLDVANLYGSPVRSGVSGEIVHAGMDDPVLLGPYNNFYGNAVVIRLDQKLSVGGGQLDVFLLYGHLSQVTVQQGQHVQPADVVGAVGMTGIAIGPHLHIEMRLGANTYQNSANPYLWLTPLPGNGAVAVRMLTADGLSWPGQRLTLARFENGQAVWGRMIETYLDNENIGPDPVWGENGAMGDVPAGYYVLVGNVGGESIRAEFFVREGETTFVETRTKQ